MSVVDHIIIAVSDLEKASQDYALMLGRAPSWRGTHPGYGSANTMFRLDNCYLELLAATGEGWAGDMVRGVLESQGQSLCALVSGTDDCDGFLENARAHGLEVGDPAPGKGVDDFIGVTRTWQTMHWHRSTARGIFSFCIRHDDLSALKMAEATGAGAVTAVDHVVVQTKSAEAAKRFYGDQLGIRLALEQDVPAWGGTQLFFRTNSMSVEVLATDKAGAEDRLWGLALKTDDIVATQKRLSDAGVDVSEVREGRKPGTKVCTAKSHVLDVPTLLIEHPKD